VEIYFVKTHTDGTHSGIKAADEVNKREEHKNSPGVEDALDLGISRVNIFEPMQMFLLTG
jgi:hypothetical protein